MQLKDLINSIKPDNIFEADEEGGFDPQFLDPIAKSGAKVTQIGPDNSGVPIPVGDMDPTDQAVEKEIAGKGKSSKAEKSHPPIAVQKMLNRMLTTEPFVSAIFGRHNCLWFNDPGMKTAGVAVRNGKVNFYFNPAFMEKCDTEGTLYFLLMHELYHILRMHQNRAIMNGYWGGRFHQLANIAADSLINRYLMLDKKYSSFPLHAPKGGWFLYNSDADMNLYSSVEKATKMEYKGNESTEAVFNFLKENQDKLEDEKDEEKEGEESDPPEQGGVEPLEVGDPVKHKSGKYGRITRVLSTDDYDWEEITKEEAMAIAKEKAPKKEFKVSKTVDFATPKSLKLDTDFDAHFNNFVAENKLRRRKQ